MPHPTTSRSTKPLLEMSNSELKTEHSRWLAALHNAKKWGIYVRAAVIFKNLCETEMHKRGMSVYDA